MPRFEPTPVDNPVASELLDEYFASRALGFSHPDREYLVARPEPSAFVPPRGTFLVVFDDDGVAAGCGGVRMLEPDLTGVARAEVKNLWLRDGYRGRGWGRALLSELEVRATELGAGVAVLDTNASLLAAQSLYRASGYCEIEPYNDNPNATHWFGKALG